MLLRLLAQSVWIRTACVIIMATAALPAQAENGREDKPMAEKTIEGRWDMTVNDNGEMRPSWLEVSHSGNNRLFGRFVGFGGSARPVSKINFKDGVMSFTVPPQWEKEDNDFVVEALLQGDSLVGTIVDAAGKKMNWVGHRAPSLVRSKAPVWGYTHQTV